MRYFKIKVPLITVNLFFSVGMMSNMILFHDLAMHAVESTAHSENKITWNMIHDRMRSTMYELTKMKFMVCHAMYIVHKSCIIYTCKVLHVQVHVM